MRYAIIAGAVMAVMNIGEVMAGPAHAHLHQRQHEKKDLADVNWATFGTAFWAEKYAEGQAAKSGAPAPAVTTPAAAPAAKPTPAAAPANIKAVNNADSSNTGLLGGLVGLSNSRTSFGSPSPGVGQTGDNAVNNYGIPYGSNVIKVASRDGYDFTNEFINTQKVPITVNVWNKVGQDLKPLSGSTSAPKTTTLTFVLAPGASQIIAIQANSQIGWAEATNKVTDFGQFDQAFGEANLLPTGSGYDLSMIPMTDRSKKYNMAISSLETPCISDPTQNSWITASQFIGTSDGSCYTPQKKLTLTTKMGGLE